MATPHPGKWKPVFKLPENEENQPDVVLDTDHIAAHACVIYNQETGIWKVLYGYPAFPEEPNNKVQTRIWDPDPALDDPISSQDIPNWPSSGGPTAPPALFCGGHTYLSDGKILWAGGMTLGSQQSDVPHYPETDIFGNNYTYIFNPETESWNVAGGESNPHAMANERYYPTLIHLGEIPAGTITGNVIAMSGWIDYPNLNREPEFYDETNGWTLFPYSGATQPFNGKFDFYPGAHLIPSGTNAGKLFFTLPMKQSYVFNPFWNGVPNGGYWQTIGGVRNDYRLNGTSTMLPLLPPYTSAKVLIIGGSTSETTYESYAINSAEVIDIASTNPQWSLLNNFLFFARKNHVSLMLPNDMLFVVGGNYYDFGDQPVYSAELIDTNTTQANLNSTMLPAHVYPRAHHTTAVLLPDATVWLAGSGELEEAPTVKHIEIYEPGYLFEGERPSIISPLQNISYGNTFNIETSHSIAAIRLIRLGVITHSTDMSQLSVGLAYSTIGSPNTYTVTPPPDANIAPPGLYMLFVLRAKDQSISGETMIPSVAKIVKLS